MNIIDSLNIKKHCAQYRVSLWECPQFLFVVMGVVIGVSIITTYVFAQRFAQEPEIAALTSLALATILFVIGHIIVSSFERIAVASRAKSQFISIMSHELRSPLSAIKWQIDVLLSDPSSPLVGSTSTLRYLETIAEQNERMIDAVNDLLEVNRIEDRDLVLRPSVLSLGDLTRKVASELERYATSNNVNMVLDIRTPDTWVSADEDRIRNAMIHLIDNAIRYSVHGGTVRIVVDLRNTGVYWEIADQGIGIMLDERERIFEKFFRSPNILRYQTEGAGVGLFIAKSIIMLSGGVIGFKPAPEQGSIFWFELPHVQKAGS